MAYFALLWKGRTIEKCRNNYEKEKVESLVNDEVNLQSRHFMEKHRNLQQDTRKQMEQKLRLWCPAFVGNVLLYIKTDQTFPNFLLKSILGFVGGIILTYLCFMFFVFQLSISLIHATIMSSVIGVLLTLGLAFSYRVRCLVFLLIPQFFSRVGRYTLTCYALVLILTGPATNTLKNSEVLSESMACGQEQIKINVQQLNDFLKNPLNLVKDSIKIIVERMKYSSSLFKKMLLRTNRLALSIVRIFQSSFLWLHSIAPLCNEEFGAPYDRCVFLLNQEITRNNNSISKDFDYRYELTRIVEAVCSNVKEYHSVCHPQEYANENIGTLVKRRLKNFSEHIKAMLFVDIQIHHTYSYSSNVSKTASQSAAGIVTEIRNRADPLLTWLSWSSCGTSLFLVLIIFRAKYYQHMFETRSRFDNQYVTKELLDLDLKRQKQGRETILPLNRREQMKYITATSFKLVPSEKIFLSRSAVFMTITTFKLLIHIVADYSLFWILTTIRYHGRFQTTMPPGYSDAGIKASGKGPVARFLQNIIDSLNIPLATPSPSPIICLPDPLPPDLRRYTQIGALIFLLWFFALFEPYGLRLRHVIMGMYRPERAKARAAWLYNHILTTRGSFMKYARRKLHRQFKYSTENKLTFRNWLNSYIPCWWLRSLLGTAPDEPHCLLCSTKEYVEDPDTILVRCETPECPGIFCVSCFSDIGELCTICLNPADYGDLSDISLENGTSDESSSDEEDDPESETIDTSRTDMNYRTLGMYTNYKRNNWSKSSKTSKGANEQIPLLKKYGNDIVTNTQMVVNNIKMHQDRLEKFRIVPDYLSYNNSKNTAFSIIYGKLDLNVKVTQKWKLKQYYCREENFMDITFCLDINSYISVKPNLHLIFVSDKFTEFMFDETVGSKFSGIEKFYEKNQNQKICQNHKKRKRSKKVLCRTRHINLSNCCFIGTVIRLLGDFGRTVNSSHYNITRKRTSLAVSKGVIPRKFFGIKRKDSKRALSTKPQKSIHLYFRNVHYMNFQSGSKLGLENKKSLTCRTLHRSRNGESPENSCSPVMNSRSVPNDLVASLYKVNKDPILDDFKYKSSTTFKKNSRHCSKMMLNMYPKKVHCDENDTDRKHRKSRKRSETKSSDEEATNIEVNTKKKSEKKSPRKHRDKKIHKHIHETLSTSEINNTEPVVHREVVPEATKEVNSERKDYKIVTPVPGYDKLDTNVPKANKVCATTSKAEKFGTPVPKKANKFDTTVPKAENQGTAIPRANRLGTAVPKPDELPTTVPKAEKIGTTFPRADKLSTTIPRVSKDIASMSVVNKKIAAKPKLKSCACQCKFRSHNKKTSTMAEQEVRQRIKTCTCATQHHYETRDVGISTHFRTARKSTRVKAKATIENQSKKINTKLGTLSGSDVSSISSSVYSRVVKFVRYFKKHHKEQLKEIKERHQGKANDDWWSPMVKKKLNERSRSSLIESSDDSDNSDTTKVSKINEYGLRRRHKKIREIFAWERSS